MSTLPWRNGARTVHISTPVQPPTPLLPQLGTTVTATVRRLKVSQGPNALCPIPRVCPFPFVPILPVPSVSGQDTLNVSTATASRPATSLFVSILPGPSGGPIRVFPLRKAIPSSTPNAPVTTHPSPSTHTTRAPQSSTAPPAAITQALRGPALHITPTANIPAASTLLASTPIAVQAAPTISVSTPTAPTSSQLSTTGHVAPTIPVSTPRGTSTATPIAKRAVTRGPKRPAPTPTGTTSRAKQPAHSLPPTSTSPGHVAPALQFTTPRPPAITASTSFATLAGRLSHQTILGQFKQLPHILSAHLRLGCQVLS